MTETHRPRIAARTMAGLALLTLLLAAAAIAGSAPPHMDIVSAGIQEVPPILRDDVPGRRLVLRIELAGPVPAPCGPGSQGYGFLVDSDKDALTGSLRPEFDDLGVDARLSAACDTISGLFVSPLGNVVVTGPTANILEIHSTVDQMPSLDFRWVAYASDGTTFTRLPQVPAHGRWATHELALY